MSRHRIVIIGSGFAGLTAARRLKKADADITILARTSHHLFQPLLYQVATGILSEGDIAPTTREILRHQKNVTVLQALVEEIDVEARVVKWRNHNKYEQTEYGCRSVLLRQRPLRSVRTGHEDHRRRARVARPHFRRV